jgi:4-hydroxybenzoyl-CoA thioesterase
MSAFVYTMPVRFSDVDHAGIVYYPRFFHYFHLTFEELWRQRLGAKAYVDLLDHDGIGFPAVRAECDFKGPLRFGDDANIGLTVTKMGGSSIHFRYRVYRAGATSADDALCADGKVICAVVDLQRFTAIPTPDKILQLLANLDESHNPA